MVLHEEDVIEWDEENPPTMGEDQIQSTFVSICMLHKVTILHQIRSDIDILYCEVKFHSYHDY